MVDALKNGEIDLVINTVMGKEAVADSYSLRRTTLVNNIPYYTTLQGAMAAVNGIEAIKKGKVKVKPIQEYYSSGN